MTAGQLLGSEKQVWGMPRKVFGFNKMRAPVVVLTFARPSSRTYVCPRFGLNGGSEVSDRLTAMDIEKQEFRRKMRGFDPEEVGYYLKSVADEVERLHLENGELREEAGRLKKGHDELRSREQVLQKTLVTAQRMAEEIKERSEAQADLVLREARMKAGQMMQSAQEQLARLEAEVSRCKIERDLFEKRLRATIDEHVSLLDQRREGGEPMDNVRVLPRRTGSEAG